MIKLEDLKIGDKVYGITSDGLGLYGESIVTMELCILDMTPPFEAVLCKGGLDIISRSIENYIFRTEEIAFTSSQVIKDRLAGELLNSDEFMERLYECATTSKRLNKYSERPIYEIAIKMFKERR